MIDGPMMGPQPINQRAGAECFDDKHAQTHTESCLARPAGAHPFLRTEDRARSEHGGRVRKLEWSRSWER